MQFQLQIECGLNTLLAFGPSAHPQRLEDYLKDLLIRHNGQLLKIYQENLNHACIYLEFSELYQANDFFDEFYEKLAPRMFYQDKSGKAWFLKAS